MDRRHDGLTSAKNVRLGLRAKKDKEGRSGKFEILLFSFYFSSVIILI